MHKIIIAVVAVLIIVVPVLDEAVGGSTGAAPAGRGVRADCGCTCGTSWVQDDVARGKRGWKIPEMEVDSSTSPPKKIYLVTERYRVVRRAVTTHRIRPATYGEETSWMEWTKCWIRLNLYPLLPQDEPKVRDVIEWTKCWVKLNAAPLFSSTTRSQEVRTMTGEDLRHLEPLALREAALELEAAYAAKHGGDDEGREQVDEAQGRLDEALAAAGVYELTSAAVKIDQACDMAAYDRVLGGG